MESLSKKEIDQLTAKNKKRFKKEELNNYKDKLLLIRAKIAGDIEHLEKENLKASQRDQSGDLSGYAHHMADMATDNFDVEISIGLANNEQNLLNMIDAALRKIEEGTYGLCEKTYKPISKKRLNAMPYAQLSIEAQEELEKEKGRGQY